jgi:hypothetical protein
LKHLFLKLFIFIYCASAGQSNSNQGCGTPVPANYAKWRNSVASVNNLVSSLKHDVCVNKKFSIVFYVVADSNKTWGSVSPNDLDSSIALLNRTFRRICVSFMNCSTVVIPNYVYNKWDTTITEKMVIGNWHADSTINIYLPTTITGTAAGYTYLPGGKDVIVVEKAQIAQNTVLHEMGHFFGLVHTFHEIGTGSVSPPPPSGVGSKEFVDRTNCSQHGDGFCDTEADSYPIPNAKDGFNNYYVVPKDNFMSYYSTTCRFTQEQYNFMALVMQGARLYLH